MFYSFLCNITAQKYAQNGKENLVNLWYVPEDAGLTETNTEICSEIVKDDTTT